MADVGTSRPRKPLVLPGELRTATQQLGGTFYTTHSGLHSMQGRGLCSIGGWIVLPMCRPFSPSTGRLLNLHHGNSIAAGPEDCITRSLIVHMV